MRSSDRWPSGVFRRFVVDADRLIGDFGRDIRQAMHVLRRRPGLTAVAIVTMAIGIGASATVFSFVDGLFFRPLPAPHSDRLVRISAVEGPYPAFLSVAAYKLLRDHAPAFDAMVAHYSTAPLYVTIGDRYEEVEGAVVSANYFSTLGVHARLGRFFTASEDEVPDRDAVAVIGYGLWQRRFGGDTGVLGRMIRINTRDFRIIGVAPDGFNGVEAGNVINEMWIPLMMFRAGYRWCDPFAQQPPCAILQVIGRRAPGVSLTAAQAQVATMAKELRVLTDPTDSLLSVVVIRHARSASRRDRRARWIGARLSRHGSLGPLVSRCPATGSGGVSEFGPRCWRGRDTRLLRTCPPSRADRPGCGASR